MLTFISGNEYKIDLATRYLEKYDIQFNHKELDLIEPQFDKIEDIAKYKVLQAYEELQKECFITDVGWDIPALNGFPGPYMAYLVGKFGPQDWINLMQDKQDRTIVVKVCLCYTDGSIVKEFTSKSQGVFLEEISKEDAYFDLDRVMSFREDKKSAAKCRADGETMCGDGNKHWDKFCKWYLKN